jgi:glutamate synthase domain-containing protein 1
MSFVQKDEGLYESRREHDACGIGAVVNISGRRDHSIVRYGNQILQNLHHRGAAGADNVTGDGAGGETISGGRGFLSVSSCRLLFRKTICYKGMFMAWQLFAYYPDLNDKRFASRWRLCTSGTAPTRFPTGAGPAVPLHRPQRRDQHAQRQPQLHAGASRTDGQPAVRRRSDGPAAGADPGGSDSACFDNMLELLVRAGAACRTR